MQMRQAAAGLAVAAALAAGCARHGDDDILTRAARTSTTAGDHRSDADRMADVDTAKAMALTLPDLPAGWTVKPGGGQAYLDASPPAAGRFGECLDLLPRQVGPSVAAYYSPYFTNAAGDRVRIDVSLAQSADAAAHQLAVFTSAAGPTCFARAVEEATAADLPKGATVGHVAGLGVPIEQMGDGAVQYRLIVPVTAVDGRALTVIEDVQVVRVGRATIVAFYITRTGRPLDAAIAGQLTRKVVDRAPAA